MHHSQSSVHSNHGDPPLEGYIVKLGRYVKSWNKRWMCIEGDSLNYYTPDKVTLKGTLKLSDIIDVKLENDGHHHYPISNSIRHSVDVLPSSSSSSLNLDSSGGSSGSGSSGIGSPNSLSNSVDKRASLNISSILNSKSNITSATTTTTLTSSNSNLSSSFSTTHFVNNTTTGGGKTTHHPINIIKEFIFSIKVPDRVYLFKTLNETDLHYWIQGIKNIQLENAIKQNELRENQRTSKRLTIDHNEVIISELFYLRKTCKDLKKSLLIERNEINKELDDFKKVMILFQDKYSEYVIKVNLELKALRNSCNNINKLNNSSMIATVTATGLTPPLNSSNNNSGTNNNNINLPKTKLGQVLWYPDESSTSCKRCNSFFNVFRRKHHCRNCGEIFCSKCTKKNCNVSGYMERVRVCDECHHLIQIQLNTRVPTYTSLTTI